MGWYSIVVINHDNLDALDADSIRQAVLSFRERYRQRFDYGDGRFPAGEVISQDHSAGSQVVYFNKGSSERVVSFRPASDAALKELANLLRWHGCSVKMPGEKRAQPPLGERPMPEPAKEP